MINHRRSRWLVGVGMFAAVSTACTDAAGYDLDYLLAEAPFIATLRESVAYESQELPLQPAEGTVPIAAPGAAILPAFTQSQLDSVGAVLTNPLPASAEVLARGEALYQTNCYVCHGAQGEGNGPVVGAGKYPLGPTLVGGTALTRNDGYIYGVIRVGRGLMPSYARIGHEDRWAIVHYVRQLQGGAAPAPTVATATAPAAAPATTAQPGDTAPAAASGQ